MRGGAGFVVAQTTATATTTANREAAALAKYLPPWLQFPGWELVAALAVVAVGAYLSKFFVRLLGRPVARRFRRQSVAQTVLRVVRLTTVLVSALFAARLVGLRLGDVVLSVTVFSAVLGIVLAPIVGSIINGVFILADQPYEIGDMIELDDGTRGFVDDITLRYTKLFTLDNTFLVIPNSTIRERDVVNFSAEDERTRETLTVLVTYESDVEKASRLFERAAQSNEGVIEGGPDIRIGSARYPAKPTCLLESYADNGVLLRLRFWVKKPYRIPRVKSNVQSSVWDLYGDEDDIEFAYPHQHLVFDDTSGQAEVAVQRREPALTPKRGRPPSGEPDDPDETPEESAQGPESRATRRER